MASYTWECDRHVLVVNKFDDPDCPMEFEIEHPDDCSTELVDFGLGDSYERHTCALEYVCTNLGVDETLFGYAIDSLRPEYSLLNQEPEKVSPLWQEVLRQLEESDEARVSLKIRFSSGTDYWGEYDEDLMVELNENLA